MAKLSKAQLKLLQGKNLGFLATLNHDGSPQVTPIWVDTDGTFALVNTAIGRVKEQNTRRDPRVAIAVADRDNPFSWVSIRGRVTEWITGREADNHIDRLAEKYTGAKHFMKSNPKEQRVIFKIRPEHVSGW